MLGLRFCARAFSSCGKRGPLFITVRGPLTIAASYVAEHRLQMRRLSSCGSRAQSLRGMWDPPRPGLEPMSPALAGRLPTTAPPGKPCDCYFYFAFSTPTSRRKRQMTKIPLGNFWNSEKYLPDYIMLPKHILTFLHILHLHLYNCAVITNVSKNLEVLDLIKIIGLN